MLDTAMVHRRTGKVLLFDEGVFIFILSVSLTVKALTPMLWSLRSVRFPMAFSIVCIVAANFISINFARA
jgi:hypothetical protein